MAYLAGNANPHQFDVTRKNIKHLAFTRGVHHCLGASLARLEIKVFIEELLRGFPSLMLGGKAERRSTWLMRGFKRLDINYSEKCPAKGDNTQDKINIALPSALYPFKLSDLSRFDYHDYKFENVFEKISEVQKQACVEMWLRNKVISTEHAARQRAEQVCYLISEPRCGEIIGVNTLYTDTLASNGETYFFNRMFIEPGHRHQQLMVTGTSLMLCFAKHKLADTGIRGIVNVNENRKLSRPGMQRIFARLGYTHQSWEEGNEVIFFEFDRIEFIS